MRITAVTCVKNEGPFVLEWIAFNRLIGVNGFLFYSNDCSDGTDRLLDRLADHGIAGHRPNPAQGRNYQMEALKDARRRRIVKEADWVWVADVDEFLNIHAPGHAIADLIEACGGPLAVSASFRFFANGGIDAFEDRPVISQFLMTHNPDLWCDQTAAEVKTLVHRAFPLKYYGAHRPFHDIGLPPPAWTDGSGRPVPDRFLRRANKRRIRAFPAKGARRFATLNHYALRSLDSYLVKNDRGDVNREHRAFDTTYWQERNDAACREDSILRYLPALEREMAALKALPDIGALHEECVALHRARRDALLAQPAYQTMRQSLRTASPYPPQEAAIMREIALP